MPEHRTPDINVSSEDITPNKVAVAHPFPLTDQPGFQIILKVLDCLRPYLPISLPLYRRLQFGRFFESSCILSNLYRDDIRPSMNPCAESRSQSGRDDMLERPWVCAFVDRGCRPETEVWMFGTWEAEEGVLEVGSGAAREAERLVRELVEAVERLPLCSSIHAQDGVAPDEQQRDAVGFSKNDYSFHASDPNIMLWGAVHERSARLLKRLGFIGSQYKAGMMPNHTFLFDIAQMPTPPPLPKGLFWGELQSQHFALVRSRTQIPRQERTMAILPSLAIYPSKKVDVAPIAWAFVGLDGSLTTLHVEPEWRGRALAKAITTKLFREYMDGFWEDAATKQVRERVEV